MFIWLIQHDQVWYRSFRWWENATRWLTQLHANNHTYTIHTHKMCIRERGEEERESNRSNHSRKLCICIVHIQSFNSIWFTQSIGCILNGSFYFYFLYFCRFEQRRSCRFELSAHKFFQCVITPLIFTKANWPFIRNMHDCCCCCCWFFSLSSENTTGNWFYAPPIKWNVRGKIFNSNSDLKIYVRITTPRSLFVEVLCIFA